MVGLARALAVSALMLPALSGATPAAAQVPTSLPGPEVPTSGPVVPPPAGPGDLWSPPAVPPPAGPGDLWSGPAVPPPAVHPPAGNPPAGNPWPRSARTVTDKVPLPGSGPGPVQPCHGKAVVTIASHVRWDFPRRSVVLGCMVEVAAGGHLAIDSGTVVKLGLGGQGNAIYVAPGGLLEVTGTAAEPVVFTSYRDNSVGGRTSAGAGAPAANDYNWAVLMDGGSSVSIDHAVFRYGSSSVSEGSPRGACSRSGATSLRVISSVLGAPMNIGNCDRASGSSYALGADLFRMPTGQGPSALNFTQAVLGPDGFARNALLVYSDRFQYSYQGNGALVAINLSHAAVDGLDLAGPMGDTFSDGRHGAPVSVWLQGGLVPKGTTFHVGPGVELTGGILVDGTAVLRPGAVVSPQVDAIVQQSTLQLGPHASLEVDGTAADPVRFRGGSSISTSEQSSLLVAHAVFTGGTGTVVGEVCGSAHRDTATVLIEDSTFEGGVSLGACNATGGDQVTIRGNVFRVPMGLTALSLGMPCPGGCLPPGDHLAVSANRFEPGPGRPGHPEISVTGWPVEGVALAGPDENRLSGTGSGAQVALSIATVPTGASWQVSPSSGAVLALSRGTLGQAGVYVAGRLELDAGATVDVSGGGIDLGHSGTLDALGTRARPVRVLTGAIADSASGGWAVAAQEGSTVDVSHAVFAGGWYAFAMNCSGPRPRAGGSFSLTSSSIGSQISLGDCDGSHNGYRVTMTSDIFDVKVASGNFVNGGGYDPSALQPAVLLYNVDPSGVDLSGPDENVFRGPPAGHVVLVAGADIAPGQSWKVSPSSGAVLEPAGCLDYHTCSGITVQGGGLLDLSPGTVVKSGTSGVGIEVAPGGTLDANGTSSEPVVFTSISDDQVDGHSNGTPSIYKPGPNAYGTAVQFDFALGTTLSHDVFEYASTAIYVEKGILTIRKSDFNQNGWAVNVEQTTGPDYAHAGLLPCSPVWTAVVDAEGSWFSSDGLPTPSIGLGSLLLLPLPVNVKVAFNTSGVTNALNYERLQTGSKDLVPWAVWKCGPVLFPETPVFLNGFPAFGVPGGLTPLYPVPGTRLVLPLPVPIPSLPPLPKNFMWFPPNFAWVRSGASVDFK